MAVELQILVCVNCSLLRGQCYLLLEYEYHSL